MHNIGLLAVFKVGRSELVTNYCCEIIHSSLHSCIILLLNYWIIVAWICSCSLCLISVSYTCDDVTEQQIIAANHLRFLCSGVLHCSRCSNGMITPSDTKTESWSPALLHPGTIFFFSPSLKTSLQLHLMLHPLYQKHYTELLTANLRLDKGGPRDQGT